MNQPASHVPPFVINDPFYEQPYEMQCGGYNFRMTANDDVTKYTIRYDNLPGFDPHKITLTDWHVAREVWKLLAQLHGGIIYRTPEPIANGTLTAAGGWTAPKPVEDPVVQTLNDGPDPRTQFPSPFTGQPVEYERDLEYAELSNGMVTLNRVDWTGDVRYLVTLDLPDEPAAVTEHDDYREALTNFTRGLNLIRSYPRELARTLSNTHGTDVVPVTSASWPDLRTAVSDLVGGHDVTDEVFFELDRNVIGESDAAGGDNLLAYLWPVAVRISDGDIIIHLTDGERAQQ